MLLASFSPHADKTNIGSVQRIESVSTFWANRFLPCSHETARPHVDLQGPLRLLLDASLDGAISGHAPYVEQLSAFLRLHLCRDKFLLLGAGCNNSKPRRKADSYSFRHIRRLHI